MATCVALSSHQITMPLCFARGLLPLRAWPFASRCAVGISRYLRQEISIRAFREWMVEAQLQSEIASEEIAGRLLSEIDALYAQYSDGHLPEPSMRQELAKLVLSDHMQTVALTVSYFFLRPLFGSSLSNPEWGASETSSQQPNPLPRSRTEPVAA